jgi:hypothetical protein
MDVEAPDRNWTLVSMKNCSLAFWTAFFALIHGPHAAAESEAELAKKLANPVAALISVPIQANYDENIGPNEDGSVWRINIQPVIPISIGEDWNLISRTILPIIKQEDIPEAGAGDSGIGDVLQSVFFSPKEPTTGGLIWGVGPVFLLDTASNDALGSEKWAAGPTGVVLKQQGPWTYGLLANHLESFAGKNSRADISATFMQPFINYIAPTKTTYGASIEATYDWETDESSVPINFSVSQLLKAGEQLFQVGAGVRYWADSPSNGPQDWGARLTITLLFPK